MTAQSKILTSVVSTFTSAYVFNWSRFLPDTPLASLPTFDGRLVVYPTEKDVRDYFSWRQADSKLSRRRCLSKLTFPARRTAHINNLYNTTFWALIQQGGLSTKDAHKRLQVR